MNTSSFPGGGNSFVNGLTVKDCDLFVGGLFLIADNKVSQNIARYGASGSGPTPTPTPTATPGAGTLGNISTRLPVGVGDRVLIAGFIVQGSAPKRVLIRAAGPSLTHFGVPNALPNPRLELHDSNSTIGTNDDWQTTQIGGVVTSDQAVAIQSSGLAPRDPAESVIIATLPPGSYTAVMQGIMAGLALG